MGSLCYGQGDRQKGHQLLLEASEVYQEIGDLMMGNSLLSDIAWDIWNHGDLSKGRALMEGYLLAQRQSHFKWGIAWSLNWLGLVEVYENRLEQSLALLEESQTICDSLDDPKDYCKIVNMDWLGRTYCRKGDFARAGELIRQSLEMAWELNQLPDIPARLEGLAIVAMGP